MKITSKMIGLVLALIVVILAVFFVTKFNSHESARVSTSSSPAKTVKKSSSSSSKVVKKNNKSSQTSSSVASTEEDNGQASSQEQTQAAGASDTAQAGENTTSASQVGGVEGGRGAWTATSGTLTLDEETPVYAAPDKDSGAVSTLPAGDVDWDKYEILPDGNWYSFVKDGQRYYISYSDVGH
ncbi:transcriptional regulator [Streptococcus salivarius]|uniref:transcriptional regulator n=1 Tax=Streptococcus salivarius TaxID=1304 RepID=UPI000BC9BC57|nr:transcriptional regulator [Streptococcus salivarius]PCR81823.1 transcriptional regulator [Streptococcus salivarius]